MDMPQHIMHNNMGEFVQSVARVLMSRGYTIERIISQKRVRDIFNAYAHSMASIESIDDVATKQYVYYLNLLLLYDSIVSMFLGDDSEEIIGLAEEFAKAEVRTISSLMNVDVSHDFEEAGL